MAFWLARQRHGQESEYIQRFDPRFWTVNFPRPMMAAAVAEQAGTLRVDCEFHHRGELCGLIWESEDRHDHPLLAYSCDRDYSRTTLRFSWRSSGLMPLDQPHGPTLTIEGRDENGDNRVWYVRLWNYAQGTPENAEIVLPFSQLESGYGLPGEPVHPADVDRMFISLVPPAYEPESDERFSGPVNGSVTLSDIACEGDRPMLEIGDVMLPPHGEQMATAYDDSYNLTPERILRSIRGLGYRGRILHYVGMSHFFRLEDDGGRLVAAADGILNLPAFRWHRAFFRACAAMDYAPICSLSYELLADHCPDDWQQRTYSGEAGRTGWEPPSALLSPANETAMGWLRSTAGYLVGLMRGAGLPILFQIGEPWWWVTSDGKPCLYDAAAVAAFGGNPPIITSMHGNLPPDQTALLDAAGALLAQSTHDLAAAVRTAAKGPAEILLLAFTPTILDPEMPELKRANVPVGWAYPAFDRLQLEDYDWLTEGADARRRMAYAEFDRRLNYPADRQDYLSGFVLDAADAEEFWVRIDAGLDEAAARGISQRFVWAFPQINRDGYTRLAPNQDNPVQAFDDIMYPLPLGRDTRVSPEFSTTVAVTASGHERRNSLWSDARLRFDVGPGIRSEAELGTLISFFRARRGAARGFRLQDPFDFSSNGMTGNPRSDDQLLGIGDGVTSGFEMAKFYGDGEEPQRRRITRPRAETIMVNVGGAPAQNWSLQPGGILSFDEAPPEGAEVRAGFLFDVPVRFAEDQIDISSASFAAGEAPSVPMVEIREAV